MSGIYICWWNKSDDIVGKSKESNNNVESILEIVFETDKKNKK